MSRKGDSSARSDETGDDVRAFSSRHVFEAYLCVKINPDSLE